MKDYSWPISAFNEKEFQKFVWNLEENSDSMYGKKIFIFGAGIRGCCFLKFCELKNIKVAGFIDNDPNKEGGCIGNYTIKSFETVLKLITPYYIIVATENSGGIIKQLTDAGLIRGKNFFSVETELYENFKIKFFRKDQYKYLFLGDCIFSQVGVGDENYDSLETMIYNEFGSHESNVLGMHGMPIRTFYHLVRLQFKMGIIPQKIILVVNTVMFTGKKNQLPRAQHTPLLRQIQKEMEFEDKEFGEYVNLTEERMERFQTDAFVASSNNIQNRNSKHIAELRMRLNYMYCLDETEEGVVYLKKMATLCKENGVEFVPFLPPINYEYGEHIFGKEFDVFCQANAQKLKDVLKEEYGIVLEDAGYLLSKEYFASNDTINEITNYQGRKKEIEFLKEIIWKAG